MSRVAGLGWVIGLTWLGTAGCSAGGSNADTVGPRVEVINQTSGALSTASITTINGRYSNCSGRAWDGSEPWTYDMVTPANSTLSVRNGDRYCLLIIEGISTATETYVASPPLFFMMADFWRPMASSFRLTDHQGPLAFYGNAKINALTFTSDFTISMLFSAAPVATDEGSRAASFATQSATVTAGTVPVSDYTVSLGDFTVAKNIDDVVISASGHAQLTAGSVTALDWAVVAGELNGSSTFAEIETARGSAFAWGNVADLTSLQVPASSFGLTGEDLSTSPKRTLILRNVVQGVASHQLMLFTFTP